jgi:hypothetical protein
MLPVMLFELFWKSIWFFGIGLPLWLGGQVHADNWETIKATLLGVILCPAVIPWRYVFETYVKAPGEGWTGGGVGRPSRAVAPNGTR